DKTAKLWNLPGRELQDFFTHASYVRSVAFSPDGKQILTGSDDNTARLWDLSDGKLHALFTHASYVRSVAFSPDGKQVLTGSYDQTAKLWDLSGRELQKFSGHTSSVNSVAFSPDGKQVLTSSYDKTAKLWDLSGRELQTFIGHDTTVSSVAFSPACPADPGGGKQVLTGSYDKTAKLWNLSGRELQTFSGHASSVNSVAFSPACPADPGGGKQILTGSDDKTAKLWDLSGRELQTFSGHTSSVRSVAFSPDGKQVLTGSDDKTAKLWITIQTDKKQAAQSWQLNGECYAVAFSPTQQRVAVGAGKRFFPYFCGLCNLDQKGFVAELSVQQRIENELMQEENCLVLLKNEGLLPSDSLQNQLIGCAKYFLLKGSIVTYDPATDEKITMYHNFHTALRFADLSDQLAPQGEAALVARNIRNILAKIAADSIAEVRNRQERANIENTRLLRERLKSVQNLEDKLKSNPADTTIAQALASACANAAWSQLLMQDYAGAVKSVERGLQVWPNTTWGCTSLALGHLLGGNWPEAEKVYTAWKDKSWKTSGFGDVSQYPTFREGFLADLDDLERRGITHKDFAKARALLEK
ncbi:MAG: WD40 repeat domain-containing protein, partial [Saprospiraceae bacterium]